MVHNDDRATSLTPMINESQSDKNFASRGIAMLNEQEDIRSIFKQISKSAEGRLCIALCLLAIALSLINIFFGADMAKNSGEKNSKWTAIWLVAPILIILIHFRTLQIFSGDTRLEKFSRFMFLLIPFSILLYFNFSE